MPEPIIWTQYQHFKWHIVKIIGIAEHTETQEELIIYKHIDWADFADNWEKIRARPKEMFLEEITKDWITFPRFTQITDG